MAARSADTAGGGSRSRARSARVDGAPGGGKDMFRLSEDQRALKERARRFAAQVVAPHVEDLDRTNEYPWPIVKALAAERFMGMNVPPEYGGDGRSLLDTVLVVEEMAKVCGTVARIVVDGNMGIVGA